MRILKAIFEFLVLAAGSVLAGFLIASIVHYLAFGLFFRYGFGKESFELAILEGGILGATAAIPTGAIIYYGILKRSVTAKQVAIILLASLVGGIFLGLASVLSVLLIPLWTIAVAVWLRRRSIPSEPASWVL